MEMCGVSRNVVQAAVRRLVAEGLVVTRPRLGCIVASPSRRPMRGVVLEIDTSSGVPYGNACFSAAFQRALGEERIDCRRVGLSYDSRDKMIAFDRERLECELAKRPDIALVSASLSRRAGIQRIMDAHDVPYVMTGSAAPGMHPHGWHSWIGYGNGSIGNLGMHIMDVAFWAHNDWTHGGIGLRLRF
jgi:DNA-binding transcriptional MocR family regulator